MASETRIGAALVPLASLSVLDPCGMRAAARRDEVVYRYIGFFLLLSSLICAVVPVEARLFALGTTVLMHTAFLRRWKRGFRSCLLADRDGFPSDAEAFQPISLRVRALPVRRAILSGRRGARCGWARMSGSPPRREPAESAGDDGESGRQGSNVRNDALDETLDLTPLGPLASKLLSVLADVFVVEDRDFVREDSINLPPSSGAKAAGSSKQPFSWGDGAEGDEALRLPTGVAAAERLGKESLKGEALRGKSKLSAPLRDDQIKDAKKDPIALVAVALIIVFQVTGSLIGLTREFLPDDLKGAAVVDEELSQRRDEVREAPSNATTGLE